jgi:dihydroflavonol-4-reductase
LVTGATGFLGRAVVAAAADAGLDVRAGCRRVDADVTDAEVVRCDVEDPDTLAAAVRGVDAVFHLAGRVSRDPKHSADMHRVHVAGTRNLLAAMTAAGVERLVLASSSGTTAVSAEPTKPMTERHEVDLEIIGRWPYYLSKLYQEREAERWRKADRGRLVMLNPSLLLGPGDVRMSSTEDVLEILHQRYPAAVDGTMAFVDVRDCAPAFVRALDAAEGKYLLNGANMSVRRFAERVANAGRVPPPKWVLSHRVALGSARWLDGIAHAFGRSSPLDPVAVDMAGHHWACDASRAERLLGFAARDPNLTIRDTVRDLVERRLFRPPRAS